MLWKASASFYIETERPLHRPSRFVPTMSPLGWVTVNSSSTEEEARRNESQYDSWAPGRRSSRAFGAQCGGRSSGVEPTAAPAKGTHPRLALRTLRATLGPEGGGAETRPRGERPPGRRGQGRGGEGAAETRGERPPGRRGQGGGEARGERPSGSRGPGGDPPTSGAEA